MQLTLVFLILGLAVFNLGHRLWRRFVAKEICAADCGCKQDIALRFRRR
jgi:hypothetical protein